LRDFLHVERLRQGRERLLGFAGQFLRDHLRHLDFRCGLFGPVGTLARQRLDFDRILVRQRQGARADPGRVFLQLPQPLQLRPEAVRHHEILALRRFQQLDQLR